MAISISLELDSSELERRVRELMKNFPEAGEQCMERACLAVERKAKQNAPVDTSTLRNSLTHRVQRTLEGTEGYVFTNEEYAPFVEFGTGVYSDNGHGRSTPWKFKDRHGKWHTIVGQRPKKFLSNALISEQGAIMNEFRRFLDYV